MPLFDCAHSGAVHCSTLDEEEPPNSFMKRCVLEGACLTCQAPDNRAFESLSGYDQETFKAVWWYFNKEGYNDVGAYKILSDRVDNRDPGNCLEPFPVDTCFCGDTLLIRACMCAMPMVIDYLLRWLGANPNKTGRRGRTPLNIVKNHPMAHTPRMRKMIEIMECFGAHDEYRSISDKLPCSWNNFYLQPCQLMPEDKNVTHCWDYSSPN